MIRHSKKFRSALMLALFTLTTLVSAQQDVAQPSVTAIRIFTPFTTSELSTGLTVTDELSGACWTSSVTTPGRPDAWRCMVDNAIYDPCFLNPFDSEKQLACAESPWDGNMILLTLAEPLPSSQASQENLLEARPWALELVSGQKCTFLTGATAPVAGMRVNYGCPDGTVVVGEIDRTLPLWRVFSQSSGSLSLDQVGVVTAWY